MCSQAINGLTSDKSQGIRFLPVSFPESDSTDRIQRFLIQSALKRRKVDSLGKKNPLTYFKIVINHLRDPLP